jgi:hypothetical protein
LLPENIYFKAQRNKSLPLVLYECETWSRTLREGHRLRVFENRVVRKREEETEEWRKTTPH